MQTPVNQILLRFFNRVNEGMVVGESIFIDDNLDIEQNFLDFEVSYSRPYSYPFKLTFTSAILCCKGSIRTTVNRHEYVVGSNDALIVQSGSIVEFLSCSDDLKIIAMAFEDNGNDELFNSSTMNANSYIMHRSVPVLMHLDEAEMQQQKRLYKEIRQFYSSVDVAYRSEVVKGYLFVSAASFLSKLGEGGGQDDVLYEGSRENELYLQFMDDLQVYGSKERMVSFYADRCCVSPKYFSKMINLASGKTPIQLIKERVIVEAKVLLNSTDMSIQQIAEALNFPNDSFFCRYFKQEVKVSPMKYREMGK
ncbi:MAG: AraC family transcriptional regulator [Bacteroidales bacterium]|nr:AraC family transcriptional regulator [Bacteroidales bacterium]